MKISSIDFFTQIDVLTNNVQNMVISHKYTTKMVQSCIKIICSPLPTKFNFGFIFTLTPQLYSKILQIMNTFELEVTKWAFTFSSEIRQIQCKRTEFWGVQCPKPAGPSALDKHQIQVSALDLSYFTRKSKFMQIYQPNSYRTEKQNHLLVFVKNCK